MRGGPGVTVTRSTEAGGRGQLGLRVLSQHSGQDPGRQQWEVTVFSSATWTGSFTNGMSPSTFPAAAFELFSHHNDCERQGLGKTQEVPEYLLLYTDSFQPIAPPRQSTHTHGKHGKQTRMCLGFTAEEVTAGGESPQRAKCPTLGCCSHGNDTAHQSPRSPTEQPHRPSPFGPSQPVPAATLAHRTCRQLSGWFQGHIPGCLRGWQYKECCLQPEHTWQWTHLSRQASWGERHQKYSHHQYASTLRLPSIQS